MLAVLLSAAAAAEESGAAVDAGNTGLYFDATDGVWIEYDGTQETHSSGSRPPYSVPPAPLLLKKERTGFDGSGSAALAPKQQPIT